MVEYNILKRDAEGYKTMYDGLLTKLKEANIAAGLKSSNIRVVESGRWCRRNPSRPQSAKHHASDPGGLIGGSDWRCCAIFGQHGEDAGRYRDAGTAARLAWFQHFPEATEAEKVAVCWQSVQQRTRKKESNWLRSTCQKSSDGRKPFVRSAPRYLAFPGGPSAASDSGKHALRAKEKRQPQQIWRSRWHSWAIARY